MKQDITSREDIHRWMTQFYDCLIADEVTRGFFTHINLEHHLPHIVQFWSFVLLDEEGYTTNVFNKHAALDLEEIHFRHWIQHFMATTDDLFEGEKAQLAKQRAKLLASTFYHKISGIYLIF
jgi:hemoglobin